MAALGSRGRWGTIADSALIASIVIAPVAGGSVQLAMLPVLAGIAAIGFCVTIFGRLHAGQRQHVSPLPIVLLVASIYTLLQAIPMPPSLLALLSPRAYEVRSYVGAIDGAVPLSYEPSATLRLGALFAIYAMIAHVAYERASNKRGFALISRSLIATAIASLVVALFHRLSGSDRMLLVLESAKPARTLLTTFVNPNHGAGFMLLASLAAVGLAVGQRARKDRVRYLAAAIVTTAASMLCLSRGGLIALGIGYVIFLWAVARSQGPRLEDRQSNLPAVVGVLIAVTLGALAWKYDGLLREFTGTEEDPLGFDGKIAAMGDSGQLILDHLWFGIGRGSYVSVYPAYKTAPHQFTYTHPENVAVQLLADWGVPVGVAALVAFGWLMYRQIRLARSTAVLGATVGVLALSLQNLVDFSLEMPGVAIPVAAILGAGGVAVVKERRIELNRPSGIAFVTTPLAILLVATMAALLGRDLDSDLRSLAGSAWSDEPQVMKSLEPIAACHPANAIVAARMAFAAETAQPPELRTALRWANRTMYLAPTYADGHMVSGRLLLRFGLRTQGFEQMRRAWTLVEGRQREPLIRQVVQLAREPEEVLEAVPRRDEVMDQPDEQELATAIRILVETEKTQWAKTLLEFGPIEAIPPGSLIPVANAAIAVKDFALAESVLVRKRELEPSDGRTLAALLEVLVHKGDRQAADLLIAEALNNPDVEPTMFLRARLDLAIASNELNEAREVLAEMQRRLAPTDQNQVFLAKMRSRVEFRDNRLVAATHALDDAIRIAPGNADLRVERARVLMKLGKNERARLDLVAALRISRDHAGARALLHSLPEKSP